MKDRNSKNTAAAAKAAPAAGRAGAFFGRRKGRPLRQKQSRLFAALLPQLQIDVSRPAPDDLSRLFPAPGIKSLRLEIGFGGGEHLRHEAARCPESGFIGAEPFINGMAKMLAALEAEPRRAANIRLYPDDAVRLLNWLPADSLAGIDIFYPDPWPKKKHWKRRFVNAETISRFAALLQTGGVLRFASDIDSYINQVLLLIGREKAFVWQAETPHDWQSPYQNWPGTRYEAKAKRAGRAPAYLTFIRR